MIRSLALSLTGVLMGLGCVLVPRVPEPGPPLAIVKVEQKSFYGQVFGNLRIQLEGLSRPIATRVRVLTIMPDGRCVQGLGEPVRPGTQGRLLIQRSFRLPTSPGPARVVVIAEDDQGHRDVRSLLIPGLPIRTPALSPHSKAWSTLVVPDEKTDDYGLTR